MNGIVNSVEPFSFTSEVSSETFASLSSRTSRTRPVATEFEQHLASSGGHHLRSAAVKRINCVCGLVVEGDDDDELWENAQQHMRDDHPDLVGKVSRDDIVAQAEETGAKRSS